MPADPTADSPPAAITSLTLLKDVMTELTVVSTLANAVSTAQSPFVVTATPMNMKEMILLMKNAMMGL